MNASINIAKLTIAFHFAPGIFDFVIKNKVKTYHFRPKKCPIVSDKIDQSLLESTGISSIIIPVRGGY